MSSCRHEAMEIRYVISMIWRKAKKTDCHWVFETVRESWSPFPKYWGTVCGIGDTADRCHSVFETAREH